MQAVLVTFKADGERRSFSLPKEVTVIGRKEDCDLRIPLGEVSRKHCRFIIDGEQLKLEDMGSSNGTFHNGARIQEAVIQPGDSVQVGPVVFVVQIDGVPADDEIEPVTASPNSDTSVAGALADDLTPGELPDLGDSAAGEAGIPEEQPPQ
jgi:pSer/pThr/pTyr-binding forkhead associated (FHA) protein